MLFTPKRAFTKPSGNLTPMTKKTFYDFTMKSIDGKEINFSAYKGKKALIVNTASECGFTPQYNELEELHTTHADKVTILGFPANNFGGQESGTNEEIATFCQRNFGVTFQLFEKSDVVGPDKNPLYQWLTDREQNGWNKTSPSWNFCKYLISENGELLKFYTAAISPMSDDIVKEL